MYQAITNIDEQEIHDAFRTKIDLGERSKKYEEVEWVAVDDKNAGNYKQNVRFDTIDMKDKLPVYRESYAVLPVSAEVAIPGASYTAATKLAFKCSVLSLIRTLAVKPVGNGPTIVNEKDGQLPLMNNLRLLTQSDVDWVECSGEELHFFGCDRYVSQNVMGTGVAGTASASHVSVTIPTTDVYTNPRLADRVSVFTSSTDHSIATKFNMIICIPLKFIHPVFDQLSFPLPNYPLKIEFGLASISNGQEDFMPLMCPQGSLVGKFDAVGAPQVQVAVLPAAAPALSIDTSISIKGFAPGACRLYLKCVTLSGKDAEDFDTQLSSGFKKTITFLTTDIYEQEAKVASANGSAVHYVFGQNTKRPLRVWAMFPPVGSLTSHQSLFLGTVGPCYLDNCNLKINGKVIRRENWMNQYELYNELRQYQLGSGYRTQQGAQISYSDFTHGTRPYLFDVSRHPSVVNNLPITFTFDGRLTDPAGGIVDPIFIVERYETLFLNITRSSATTTVQSGLPENDRAPDEAVNHDKYKMA